MFWLKSGESSEITNEKCAGWRVKMEIYIYRVKACVILATIASVFNTQQISKMFDVFGRNI